MKKNNRTNQREKIKLNNQQGIMLITTLGLIASISVLSAAILMSSVVEIKASEKFEQRMIAFHWAEGAIDQTIANLRTNSSYSGVPSTTGTGRVAGSYLSSVTSLGNNVYQVSATGAITGTASVLSQYRSLQAYINLASQSPFNVALFTNQTVTMSGNAQIDAYDSRLGTYSSQTPTNDGDVGSNWNQGHAVSLSGNAKIKGDVVVGPNSNLSIATVTSGNALITGTVSAASAVTSLPAVTVPGSATNIGSITLNGNDTQTLASGTYVVSSISITGNGRLNLSGSTTIYVTGNIGIAGNGISTASNLPTNLTLNVQGTRTVSLSGNGSFYGAIYAPSSAINISGNGKIYGAVVSNTIADSGNGNIHYDKALGSVSGGSSFSNQVTYWTEL